MDARRQGLISATCERSRTPTPPWARHLDCEPCSVPPRSGEPPLRNGHDPGPLTGGRQSRDGDTAAVHRRPGDDGGRVCRVAVPQIDPAHPASMSHIYPLPFIFVCCHTILRNAPTAFYSARRVAPGLVQPSHPSSASPTTSPASFRHTPRILPGPPAVAHAFSAHTSLPRRPMRRRLSGAVAASPATCASHDIRHDIFLSLGSRGRTHGVRRNAGSKCTAARGYWRVERDIVEFLGRRLSSSAANLVAHDGHASYRTAEAFLAPPPPPRSPARWRLDCAKAKRRVFELCGRLPPFAPPRLRQRCIGERIAARAGHVSVHNLTETTSSETSASPSDDIANRAVSGKRRRQVEQLC